MCHKIGVDNKNIKLSPLDFLGLKMSNPHENHSECYIMIGIGIVFMTQSIINISRCLDTFQTPCMNIYINVIHVSFMLYE